MDDLSAFQELVKVLTSGGTGNALLVFIAFMQWKLDKRVSILEMALGVTKVPQVIMKNTEKGFVKLSALVSMIVVSTILSACSATTILAGAALLQGRTALQFNAGSMKAGVALTLPKTVTMPTVIAPSTIDAPDGD